MEYFVTVYEIHKRMIRVIADNPDHARKIVKNMLENGEPTYTESEYYTSMAPEKWEVETKWETQ